MTHTNSMLMWLAMKIFKNKTKNIEFICESEEYDFILKPVPADRMISQWYKDMPSYMGKEKEYSTDGTNATIKKCMPVFDSMTTGYFILLPCDVYVEQDANGNFCATPSFTERMISDHQIEQAKTFDIPPEYYKQLLKWRNFWKIKTPKGWSVMFVQPMHRDDLPFSILPAIVDTDEFVLSVQFPMLFRKDFKGVIPKGTPIAQVIPFKREEWTSSYRSETKIERDKFLAGHQTLMENRYKRTSWKRKTYK